MENKIIKFAEGGIIREPHYSKVGESEEYYAKLQKAIDNKELSMPLVGYDGSVHYCKVDLNKFAASIKEAINGYNGL